MSNMSMCALFVSDLALTHDLVYPNLTSKFKL